MQTRLEKDMDNDASLMYQPCSTPEPSHHAVAAVQGKSHRGKQLQESGAIQPLSFAGYGTRVILPIRIKTAVLPCHDAKRVTEMAEYFQDPFHTPCDTEIIVRPLAISPQHPKA